MVRIPRSNVPKRPNVRPTAQFIYMQRGDMDPPVPPLPRFAFSTPTYDFNARYLLLDDGLVLADNFLFR